MLPTEQRFKADNFSALDLLLRLIHKSQFVTRNRMAQIVFEHSALTDLGAHLCFEETIGVAAFGLGAVERRVGVGEKRLAIRRIVGTERDTDTRRDLALRRII